VLGLSVTAPPAAEAIPDPRPTGPYVVNRDDMGDFNSASDSEIVQSLVDIFYKRLSRKLLDGVLLADFAGL